MCHVHYPNEMQHGNALICLAVHLFIGDPYFGLALRVALIPLGAGLRIGGWMADSKDLSLVMFFFMNEALCCFAFLLIFKYFEFLLGQLQQTATDLQVQMQQREQDARETKETLLAARRLLSVTCDCCEQLTENWDIAEPSQSILALLQINNPEEDLKMVDHGIPLTLPFLEFIWEEDQERFVQFSPSSLHLRMKTCHGHSFEAQLFHVDVPGGLIGTTRHLIGISKLEGEMHRIPEHCPLVSSPFLGATSGDTRSVSSSGSGISAAKSEQRSFRHSHAAADHSQPEPQAPAAWGASDVDRFLQQIDYISLQLDLRLAEGYPVRALQLVFRDPPQAMHLKNWTARKCQKQLEQFLQGLTDETSPLSASGAMEFRVPGLEKMRFRAHELRVEPALEEQRLSIRLDLKSVKFR
ncbi:unnamed protein product [Durusdinium trenchii]